MKKLQLRLTNLHLFFPSTSRVYTLCQRILFTAILMASLGGYARAQTATTKPIGLYQFPFSPGTVLMGQTEIDGMTWAATGPPGPQINIASNSLAVAGLASPAGNRARLAGVNGPAARIGLETNVTSGTIYYSLALRVADLGTLGTSGGTVVAFNNATGANQNLPAPLAARLLLRAGAGGYQLGLSKSSTNSQDFVWAPPTFSATDVVFVVGAYEFKQGQGTSSASLWINPPTTEFGRSSAPAPTVTTSAGLDIDHIESFVLMQRPQPILPAVTFVDEVRVGTSWAVVTPPSGVIITADIGRGSRGCAGFGVCSITIGLPVSSRAVSAGLTWVNGRLQLNFLAEPPDKTNVLVIDQDISLDSATAQALGYEQVMVRAGQYAMDYSANPHGQVRLDTTTTGVIITADIGRGSRGCAGFGVCSITIGLPVSSRAVAAGATWVNGRLQLNFLGEPPDKTNTLVIDQDISLDNATAQALGYEQVTVRAGQHTMDYSANPHGRVLLETALPNLAVAVVVSPNPVIDTSNCTYSITVSNLGAGVANGTILTMPLPKGLTFTSVTASQGSCSNSPSGLQCNLGTLPPGATATLNVVGIPDFNTLATMMNIPEMQETISLSNSISVAASPMDANPLNNIASVVAMVVPQRDFGDAPQPPYPTLLPNGARHRIGALRFGALIDAEPNGQPVNLDDVIGLGDEIPDGFGLPALIYAGGLMPITIQVSGPAGYIDLWVDVDGVPGWGPADHVLVAVPHPGGGAVVGYAIPIPGGIAGPTWARARVGLNPAGLPTTGYGGFGEVVDFPLNILPGIVDLVAVASPNQITVTEDEPLTQTITVSNKGPSTASGVTLEVHFPPGATLKNLYLSQGTGKMEGTNLVCRLNSLSVSQSVSVTFTAGTSNIFEGRVDEFMDWCFWLYATETELNPDDNLQHGMVRVYAKRDFGDAPLPYPTRLPTAARHRIGALFMGARVDAEPNGQPNPLATGDDLAGGPDDEDGVMVLDPIVPGTNVRVRIISSGNGFINAWIDWDRNGVWDASEQIFTCQAVVAGPNILTFTVPTGLSAGFTYARYRLSSACVLGPEGPAPDGEVEDYRVLVRAKNPLAGPKIALSNGRLTISHDSPDALLEEADDVSGPWRPVRGASRPFVAETNGTRKFYRLRMADTEANFEAMAREADLIFEGVVTRVEYHNSSVDQTHHRSVPHTFVTFRSDQILKGRLADSSVTLRFLGGITPDGQEIMETSRSTFFDVGQRSILFVAGNGEMALPLVESPDGRFRVINDVIVTEDGREVLWTKEARVGYGKYRGDAEVINYSVGPVQVQRTHSPHQSEAGPQAMPVSGELMSKAQFTSMLAGVIQRAHSAEELARVPLMPSADPSKPFFIGDLRPAMPRLPLALPKAAVTETAEERQERELLEANGENPVLP